jgi:AcrR family transcriptional regulator
VTVWRGTTAAQRVGPRRARLLAAGLDLLGEQGYEGITVRGVCAAAGLNPRYFYESFDDLDALVGAVYDEIEAEATRRALAAIAIAPDSAEAKAHAALDTAIRYVTEDPRRIRIVLREGGSVLHRRRAASIGRSAAQMADLAAAFLDVPRDDKLLVSSAYMLTGGISGLLVAWQNGSVDLTTDELVGHATQLVIGFARSTRRDPAVPGTAPR